MRYRFGSSFAALAALCALLAFTPLTRAAGLLVADGGLGGALEVKEHDVKVVINNGVAVTTVTQVFLNTEDRQVEALYTFPVPKGGSVANFSMWINGKEMVGEVMEKKKAREIYDSYKRVRRDPGLLEQTNHRTFEMRIFPIGPRAEQKVQVTYYQELNVDNDWATYVYPLATSTRTDINSKTTGKFAISFEAKSEVPIAAMESPSHAKDFAIAKHNENYYQASLETKAGELNRDVVLAYHLVRPKTGIDMITSKQGGDDGYFCLTMTAGEELAEQNSGMDYVFLLDISGSMNDDGKLGLSRNAVGAFVNALGEKDRFEVMAFNVLPTTLFQELQAANLDTKKKATDFLTTQQARGGTVLQPAMTAAYKYADKVRPLNVILLSDGMTEQGERAGLMQLIASRPAQSRVFCIGVGNDVNRSLLEQLANDSGGLAAFVSREDNFERQAAGFRRKLLRPVASDIALDFGDAQVYDVEPQKLQNLYHGMPVRLYGRYRGAGPVTATLSSNVSGKPTKQTVNLDFPREDAANPEIERMWAWKRVDRLLNQADAAGSRTSVLDEITFLGDRYSIATEYTSFIVLENDGEYQRWRIDRRNQLRLSRDRAAQTQLATQLEAMRNKAASQLGPVTEGDKPAVVPAAAIPGAATPSNTVGTPQQSLVPRPNSQDVSLPVGGGGGGALDPLTAGAVLLFTGVGYILHRRSKNLPG